MGGTHSRLSPSGAERWWNCPYSLVMDTLYPRETKRDAAEGTVMHEIAAKILTKWWDAANTTGMRVDIEDAGSWVGEVIEADGFKIKVTEDMADAIMVYCRFITELTELDGRTGKLLIEYNAPLTLRGEECGGTVDALYVSDKLKKVFINDLKGGRGVPVSVERNRQMLQYACGVIRTPVAYESWELTIIQPRYNHADGRIRRKVYSFSDILLYQKELSERIEYIRSHPDDIQPGKWCRWCAGHGRCADEAKQNIRSAEADFTNIDTSPAHTLTPDQIAQYLNIEDSVKAFYEGLHNVAIKLQESGVDIPGYKAIQKYGHRKWIDEDKVVDDLGLVLGDKIYDRKLKSPSGIEKLLGSGKDGKEKFRTLCAPNVETPIIGVDLVPLSDAREAIKGKAELDFQEPNQKLASVKNELGL